MIVSAGALNQKMSSTIKYDTIRHALVPILSCN